MRWSIVVMLLALLLGGCRVDVVPGGAGSSGGEATATSESGASGQDPQQDADTADADTADEDADTTVDAQAGGERPETRAEDERTAVTIVNEFWKGWFAQQGRRYVPPRVAGGYIGRGGPSCDGEPSVPGNAYYCPPGNFLAWDENLMRAGYDQIGDAWVYLVIAHEWGHAIQDQLPRRLVDQAVELQADCLAGAALQGAADQGLVQIQEGDQEEIQRTLVAVADDYPWTDRSSHGDAEQRYGAFKEGVSGGVDACLA